MTTETAQIIAGGAYCAGYLHGRRAAEQEYKSCTYWPILMDPVVAAYCRTLRLVSARYSDAIARAEKAVATAQRACNCPRCAPDQHSSGCQCPEWCNTI